MANGTQGGNEGPDQISAISAWVANLRYGVAQPWVRTVAVLWIAQVVSEIGFGFALPFTPLFVQELGVTDVRQAGLWAGFTAGAFAVAMGVMAPFWGVLSDRFGYRLMIQRAFFGAGLAIGGIAFVQTPEQMLALRIVHGILTGVYTGIAALVSLETPQHHLGTVLGLMQSALFLGIALGPLLGGAFADHFGLRATFGATGVILVTAGVLIMFVVRDPVRATPSTDATDAADTTAGSSPGSRLLSPQLAVVVGLMALARFANVAPNPILPLFVQQLVDSPEHLGTTVGFILGATGVASTLSALLVGRLADRYGRRAPLMGCLVLAAALAPLHAFVGAIWQLVILRTIVGVAQGGMATAIQALTIDLTPVDRRGAAIGLLTTATAVGNGGGPIAGSSVAAAFGVQAVFLGMAPLYAIAAAALARLRLARADQPSPI